MATTTISGAGTRNNGGTLLQAGNVPSSRNFNDLSHIENAHDVAYGSIVNSGVDVGVIKAVTAGTTFAKMETNKYVSFFISGGTLAGKANTVLQAPASEYYRQTIHKTTSDRRYDLSDWSYVNGTGYYGANAGASFNYVSATGQDVATDDAASPTRAIPGELVYRDGSANPIQDDYKAL